MTTPSSPLPAADAGVGPPPPPRRRLWFLGLAALVAVAGAVPVVVLAMREDPPANPDRYESAPKCDLFSAETIKSFGESPVDERNGRRPPGAVHFGRDPGYTCYWGAAEHGVVSVGTDTYDPDGSGTRKAAEWIAFTTDEYVTDPRIGNAATLQVEVGEGGCELRFHRSNLVVSISLGRSGAAQCRAQALALGVEFDRNLGLGRNLVR